MRQTEEGDVLITMSELLKDSTYRKFLETKPNTPKISRDPNRASSPTWVVYVQREQGGGWGKKEFWKYSKALKFMYYWVLERGAYDAALNNKRHPTDPPMRLARIKGKFVRGSDGVLRQVTKYVKWVCRAIPLDGPEHRWCMYCRRPVVFKFYTKHKRLGVVDPGVKRCCICGASERIALPLGERRA